MLRSARAAISGHSTRWRRGRLDASAIVLATNLSFVLHERSDGRAVTDQVQRVRAHQRNANRLRRPSILTLIADMPAGVGDDAPDLVLTATLGLPPLLPAALRRVGWGATTIHAVDDGHAPTTPTTFFRAPAELVLPADADVRVAAAALILRPGRKSAHLRVYPVASWVNQRQQILDELQSLIQAHADQWMAPRQLWSSPAERLLAEEIIQPGLDAADRQRR